MACKTKKSDVFRNEEKYMNDAAHSMLSNLVRVVKRRESFIWALPEHNSPECIAMETDVGTKAEMNNSKTDLKIPKVINGNKRAIVRKQPSFNVNKCNNSEENIVNKPTTQDWKNPERFCTENKQPTLHKIVSECEQIFRDKISQDKNFSADEVPIITDSVLDISRQSTFEIEVPEHTNKEKTIITQLFADETVVSKSYNDGKNFVDRYMPRSKNCSLNEIDKYSRGAFRRTSSATSVSKGENYNLSYIDRDVAHIGNYSILEDSTAEAKFRSFEVHQPSKTNQKEKYQKNYADEEKVSLEFQIAKSKDIQQPYISRKTEDFQDWCLRRKVNHAKSSQKPNFTISSKTKYSNPKSTGDKHNKSFIRRSSVLPGTEKVKEHENRFPNASKTVENNSILDSKNMLVHQVVTPKKSVPNASKTVENNSILDSKNTLVHQVVTPEKPVPNEPTKKRNRHNSTSERKHKVLAAHPGYFNEETSKNNRDMAETMLSIIISVKDEKYHEILTEYRDLLQLKKNFPKISEVIPDVDSKGNEFNYSADAMKAILGFLFSPSYNFAAIRNETVAMEVIALMHSWGITKFQDIFHKHILQNILKESNAKKIYSLAEHFSLNDIKDACKKFVITDNDCSKYRIKKCSVAISTYTNPLEFCIPLYPMEEQLIESFNRSLQNEVTFESVSGCYVITGIQIQFNVGVPIKIDNSSDLTIFYSAENISEKLEIQEQKIYKSLRSEIFINFNKDLVVKPKQKVKISIDTEVKPCLCYTFQDEVIEEKVPGGDFRLTLKSNRTVNKSDKKAFFIGKLFYRIKSQAI